MKDASLPLADARELPARVLVIAPHARDAVLGCGGMLAFHADRGDALRVVVLTGGGDARAAGGADARTRESERAARELGVGEVRFLGLVEGELGEAHDLVERILAELEEHDPDLVYAPSADEDPADHAPAALATAAALARGSARRVLLYGVHTPGPGGVLFDTTVWHARKHAALAAFATQGGAELVRRAEELDAARALAAGSGVEAAEAFFDLASGAVREHVATLRRAREGASDGPDPWAATAVISTWNKVSDVRANLDAIRAQTRPFANVVVVDNASSDATAAEISAGYPEVRLIVMPHSAYGACETFNIGFSSATTPLIAILDDDVVLPPTWLERSVERMQKEPETTAIVSTEVIEPGMPEAYINAPEMRRERYMSTFRGCASLARKAPLAEAGYYDERLFIYGNERDLTCRLLHRGYRVLQYPSVHAFHKTPFGIKMGKRSLYYHARNAWLSMLKYAPLGDLLRLPWLVVTKVLLRQKTKETSGEVSDATGTIGIGRSLRETPGAWLVLLKAGWSVLLNVPYCLKHRTPVRAPDFELPLK